jgi:uncharacterized membrane protein
MTRPVPAQPPSPLLLRSRLPARPYGRVAVALVLAACILILGLWLLGTPDGVLGKADAIGYAICHQIADRSFQVDGHPLPLCARCTGIYLGVMTGFAILVLSDRRRSAELPPTRLIAILAVFVVVMGLDGINSFLHLFPGYAGPYEPSNTLRLLTGSLAGTAMINLLLPAFNTSLWARPQRTAALRTLPELGGLLVVVLLVDAIVLLGNPIALLVLGLISAAGPALVLTLVWTVLFVSVTRHDNSALTWRDLILPLVAGLALTFLMIGGIDALRLAWTGTWAGFDFSALLARG